MGKQNTMKTPQMPIKARIPQVIEVLGHFIPGVTIVAIPLTIMSHHAKILTLVSE